MLTRFKINLIAILMCVCLTSVGFSAWTITGTSPSVYVSGTVSADQVINSNDYIELDKTKGTNGYEIFTFCSEGFVVDGQNLAYTGDIVAYYLIHGAKCIDLFGNGTTSINANFKLSYAGSAPTYNSSDLYYSNYGIFKYIRSAKITIGANTYNVTPTCDDDGTNYANIAYNIPISETDINVKVVYTINSMVDATTNNYQYVYAGLYSGSANYTFKIDTTLTETGA